MAEGICPEGNWRRAFVWRAFVQRAIGGGHLSGGHLSGGHLSGGHMAEGIRPEGKWRRAIGRGHLSGGHLSGLHFTITTTKKPDPCSSIITLVLGIILFNECKAHNAYESYIVNHILSMDLKLI